MSFDKDYPNRKDKRKPYKDAKRFACRCHGSCPYCKGNRTFFDKKRRVDADLKLKEFLSGDEEKIPTREQLGRHDDL